MKNVEFVERFAYFFNHVVKFLSIWRFISISYSRTNHHVKRFQRYPRAFPVIPYNVSITSFLRVGVISIRVGVVTAAKPTYRSVKGGTVKAGPVIVLVRCGEPHVVAGSQAITYNYIVYERLGKLFLLQSLLLSLKF